MKITAISKDRIKYGATWVLGFFGFVFICLLLAGFLARSIARHTPVHLPPAPSPAQVLHLPSPKK